MKLSGLSTPALSPAAPPPRATVGLDLGVDAIIPFVFVFALAAVALLIGRCKSRRRKADRKTQGKVHRRANGKAHGEARGKRSAWAADADNQEDDVDVDALDGWTDGGPWRAADGHYLTNLRKMLAGGDDAYPYDRYATVGTESHVGTLVSTADRPPVARLSAYGGTCGGAYGDAAEEDKEEAAAAEGGEDDEDEKSTLIGGGSTFTQHLRSTLPRSTFTLKLAPELTRTTSEQAGID